MLIKPYIELQQLMERKGYNQKELAAAISRRLNGYSPATLSNRLNGKAPFPVDEIVVIGELLSISPDEMYGYFIKPWAIQAKRAKKNPAKSNRLKPAVWGLRHRNCALPCWPHWLPDRMTRRALSFRS